MAITSTAVRRSRGSPAGRSAASNSASTPARLNRGPAVTSAPAWSPAATIPPTSATTTAPRALPRTTLPRTAFPPRPDDPQNDTAARTPPRAGRPRIPAHPDAPHPPRRRALHPRRWLLPKGDRAGIRVDDDLAVVRAVLLPLGDGVVAGGHTRAASTTRTASLANRLRG